MIGDLEYILALAEEEFRRRFNYASKSFRNIARHLEQFGTPSGYPAPARTHGSQQLSAGRRNKRYKYGAKGGIWTTIDALNAERGLTVAKDDVRPYGVDELF